jgi:hypothetical protein
MRLTLRTMLAYLDDILEPDDTADIGKKIEESEFATNLVHRTRDCMRRLRLGVPATLGRGLAGDPNSVAEYLDNTLAADRVGEFEKICLESDVHLAEVASCHQILTLVLGEPAEIDPDARQRVYRLAAELNAPPVQSDALRPAAAGAATAVPVRGRAKREVPDYLRETRSRFWPLAAMVLVAALFALLTFGGLMAFGPASLRERAIAMLRGGEAAEQPDEIEAEPAAENPATIDSPARPEASATAPLNGAATEQPAAIVAPDAVGETVTNPGTPAAASQAPVATDAAATPAGDVPSIAEQPAADATTPADDMPDETPEQEPRAADATAASPKGSEIPATTDAPARTEPASDILGRYTSKREVLLGYDAGQSTWKRLPAMSALNKGERLLSLPMFRPTITLSSSVTIQAEGPSLFEMAGWTDQDVPIIEIEFGRLLMATVGKAGNAVQLKLGDQQVQVLFADADATLALEVRRVLPPGKDPEEGLSPLAVDLYATSGLVRVREGEKLIELQAPKVRTLFATSTQQSSTDFPKWVNSEALTGSEREATTAVEPMFGSDESAATVLKQLTDSQQSLGRRREVRALATRSLMYLGDYEPCVAALNDPKEKLAWGAYMEELRSAVARGPETAAQIRKTFEKQRSSDAAFLYRMLWGYTAADLKNGAAQDLVNALDKDSLDYRVMGFWNLQNITGAAHHGYRPEDMANKRRTPYNAWKEKLRLGKIVPQSSVATPKGKAAASKGG